MAVVTNTLTRWHKIAERVSQKLRQVGDEITEAVDSNNMDASVLAIRGNDMKARADVALTEGLARYERLSAALVAIRATVARANIDAGVTALLAEQEAVKRRIGLLSRLSADNRNAMSIDEALTLHAGRSKDENRSRYDDMVLVSALTNERRVELRKQCEAAELALVQLSDRLADTNATRVSVTLDDELVAELGLQGA